MNTTMGNDDAFMNLLSSQRQLLSQLNRENTADRRTTNNGYAAGVGGAYDASVAAANFPGSMLMGGCQRLHQCTNKYPIVSPNQFIHDMYGPSSTDGSRRVSLGLGNDFLEIPSAMGGDDLLKASGFGPDPLGFLDITPHAAGTTPKSTKKRQKDDFGFDDIFSVKKRRMSNAGLICALFSEDSQPQNQLQQPENSIQAHRRHSLSSLADGVELSIFPEGAVLEEQEDPLDEWHHNVMEPPARHFSRPNQPKVVPKQLVPQRKQIPKAKMELMSPKEARKALMALHVAMEKSQQTQQDIHDWDRQMGLKRSHCKTMRLTTRSRKKLRQMLKKQINALNSKKR
jgi:hypothetical protein